MNTSIMRARAISIVELVVVLVVLGLVAAMTIPQFSQAAPARNVDAELRTNLAVLRTAVEMYYNDHDAYPGWNIGENERACDADAFIRQLSHYSDADGRTSLNPNERFRFGPYLRNGVPECPVSFGRPSANVRVIQGEAPPAFDINSPKAGWIYNADTGYIAANSPGSNEQGVRYDAY